MSSATLRALGGLALILLIILASMTVTRTVTLGCRPVALEFVEGYGFYWLDECGRMHHGDLDGNERWVK